MCPQTPPCPPSSYPPPSLWDHRLLVEEEAGWLSSAHCSPPCWLPCAGGEAQCADRQAWGQHYPDLSRLGTRRQCHGSLGAQELGDRRKPLQMSWLRKEAASQICAAQLRWKLFMPPGQPPGCSCVPIGGNYSCHQSNLSSPASGKTPSATSTVSGDLRALPP